MSDSDAKGRLQELAAQGAESLPLARRQVTSVRPDGVGRVLTLSVADAHNFTANGAVVGNCDSLRYLTVQVDQRRGGDAPVLDAVPEKVSPLDGIIPPSPWGKKGA